PAARSGEHQAAGQRLSTSQAATTSQSIQGAAALPVYTVQELDDFLSLITGNNTPEARRLGAKKLLDAATPEAAERLAIALRTSSPDFAAQIAICQAIATADKPLPSLIDPLLSLLGSQQADTTEAVVNALRHFDCNAVVERLRPFAADPSLTLETRLAAIGTLGAMGDNFQVVAALVSLTQDKNAQVRSAVLVALAQVVGVEHLDADAAQAWWRRHESMSQADWTAEVNERRIAQNNRLRNERNLLSTRLIAAYREVFLHSPEDDRSRRLLAFLSDELPEIRDLGLDLVNAAITDRKDVTAEIKVRLTEMISDPNPAIRLKVAQIIGDLRLTGAVSKLIEALGTEVDHRVRSALVNAIGRLDGSQAVPALVDRLNDDVPSVVAQTAMALANIARTTVPDDPLTLQAVSSALLERFALVPPQDDELREKLLDAMTRIGAESFRQVFKAEMAADRSVRIRRAALAGLATYADLAAADEVLPLLAAPEPEMRLAAVTALGKCGRRESDLAALNGRFDSKSESDPAVRQRAWESFMAIAQRLPPQDLLRVAEQFARPDDKAAQRQRLELLTSLRSAGQRFEQLKSKRSDKRVDALEAMADAHARLGEYAAASACLVQAMELIQDSSNPRYAMLGTRSVAVLLAGHEDEEAVQRLKELAIGDGHTNPLPDATLLVETAVNEATARSEAISDAATFNDATRLLDLLVPIAGRVTPSFGKKLEALREAAQAKRNASIDSLLALIAVDPQAETKLLGFGAEIVLKRLCARLTEPPTTTAPTSLSEEKLVQFAKRLAPDWPGYPADASPHQRAAALEALKSMSLAAPLPRSPTSAPATPSSAS
ncbi:MAG TPA: HEAT repeat domain-containing protein, partial [Phycisphaerae bacterium]|nr:HEAT repeat domain-containing protein [Phycisphaerae bacterium]